MSKGMSIFNLVRELKNGRQTAVNLVITKLRTKEDFAHKTGSLFECDSTEMMSYLNNADSLKKYGLDTNTVMSILIPDTYTYFWNTTPDKIFKKLSENGVAQALLDRVHAPIGLRIGARSPQEIAVAILGEIIQTFNSPPAP